ncbi:MAG: hypothetical protein ABIQ15_17265 [Nocardioides sp.]
MDTEARTTGVPTHWRAVAVAAAVAVNLGVFWFAIDNTLSTPPSGSGPSTEPTSRASGPSSPRATGKDEAPVPADIDVAVLLTATPDARGILDVVERVSPGAPFRQLLLRSPPALAEADVTPKVLGLTLVADGRPVQVPAAPTREWLVVLPQPADTVVLRYRLGGVIVRNSAAPEGRALLQVRPLTSAAMSSSTAAVEILGVTVHNLVCPDRPLADQLCGRPDGNRWRTATVPNGEATVVAQIDLPALKRSP